MSLLLIVLAMYVGLWRDRPDYRGAAVLLAAAAGVDYGQGHLGLAAFHGLLVLTLWRVKDVARHYLRLRRAWRRLRHYEIRWDGFARTRGAFTGYRLAAHGLTLAHITTSAPRLTTSSGEVIPVDFDPWAEYGGPGAPLVVHEGTIRQAFRHFAPR